MSTVGQDDVAGTLTAASSALEKELARCDELSKAARKIPLNSEKNIERASRALTEAHRQLTEAP